MGAASPRSYGGEVATPLDMENSVKLERIMLEP